MAVVFNDVYYSHQDSRKNNYALKGVYMNVHVGCIYGLLGPSGCGKTTLLKCVIGLLQPQNGKVSVFGFDPRDERSGVPGIGVGYMPQELAIQYDLTIEEILTYFGKIYCMESEVVKSEIECLVNILELKDKRQLIGNLSGGQIRRVSLAVAMIHKPRLLILDEPTVGVDPILREVIWNMMLRLSKTQQTTIIITTHYIDETKRANTVALMRGGEILQENSPEVLLRNHESKTLQGVFLKICYAQKKRRKCLHNERRPHSTDRVQAIGETQQLPLHKTENNRIKVWFKILFSIIWKYMIETRRNPFSLVLILSTTITIVFGISVAIGKTPLGLTLAFVDDEALNYNNSLFSNYKRLNGEDGFYNTSNTEYETNESYVSEIYLPNILKQSINGKIIKLVKYSNFSQALQDARKRKINGVLHLKSNFSESYLQSDLIFADTDDFVSDKTIETGNIYLHLDLTNQIVSKTIEAVILDSLQKFRSELAAHFEINQLLVSPPLSLKPINDEDKPVRSIEDAFSGNTFITPGLVLQFSFMMCFGLSIISLFTPAECDMFVRNHAAGVKSSHVIFGQIIARFIFMAPNAIINLLSMVYILDVPCNGPVFLILTLMWMQMFLGFAIGTVVSIAMSDIYLCLQVAIALGNILMASSGIIWGIEMQPYYIQWVTRLSPLYYSVTSLRSLLFYSNSSLAVIVPGFISTFIWTGVFVIMGLKFFVLKK